MGLLKILFVILLVVFFPLGEVARITLGEAAVTLTDIGVFLLSLVWVYKVLVSKKKIKGQLIKPVAIFSITLILSLALNFNRLTLPQFVVSALYIIRWVFYVSLYLVVKDFDSTFKKNILNYLKIGGLIILAIGLTLFFFYPDLRNLRYLGWDEHLYRNFSSFLDPNFAGIFFVLYFVLVFSSFKFKKTFSKLQLIDSLLIILSLVSVLITYSRAAYLALAVAIFSFAVIRREIKILLFILPFAAGLFLVSNFSLRSEGTNLLREASAKSRVDSINHTLTIFKDNPIFGVGFNAYRYAQKRYRFINEGKILIHSAAGTENSFLFVLATAGAVGFTAFFYLIYKTLIISLETIRTNKFSEILFISLLSLCINALFLNSLFYPSIMLWMWILAGLRENT